MTASFLRRALRRVIPRGLIHFVRHPKTSVAFAVRGLASRLGYSIRCRVRDDLEVRCHPNSRDSFASHAGDEEFQDELAGFVALCRPNATFLDVGSHYGVFTLAALHYGDQNTRVWAVDPSPKCHRVLATNLRLAGAEDRVRAVRAAVGETDGDLTMLSAGASGYDFFVAASPDRPDARRIPQYRLETLAGQIPSRVTHLKIDVEGHEWEVILGSLEYLRETAPILFLELHCAMLRSRGKDPEELLRELSSHGYTRFEHRGKPILISDAARQPVIRLICLPVSAIRGDSTTPIMS